MNPAEQIARDFVNNMLDPDLKSVPSMGHAIEKLHAVNINTTDELVGQFFWLNRNEVNFVTFLEECGIDNKSARDCASKMYDKFGRL